MAMSTKLTGMKYVVYQTKRLFIEYPEISYMTLAALMLTPVMIHRAWWENRHPNCIVKSYKDTYTIYRPDDPRSYRIRCSPDLPPGDPHFLKI